MKPVTLEVIFLPSAQSLVLPRGKQRQQLAASGRVKSVQFKRTMSALQVRNVIISNFSSLGLQLQSWEFLDVKGGKLGRSECQEPGGDVICQRRGAVYLKVLFLLTVESSSTPQLQYSFLAHLPLFRVAMQ